MPHEVNLITTIAAALGLAMVFGFVAARLKLPPLAGYLLAGIVIGPNTRGFVADVALAGQLAEIGVMLLMFGVGLHFSLDDLASVRGIALPGAVVQIVVATALGTATAMFWGWSFGAGLVFGLALSVASTVVLLRALEARGVLETFNGHIAVGWLIVEDLVTGASASGSPRRCASTTFRTRSRSRIASWWSNCANRAHTRSPVTRTIRRC